MIDDEKIKEANKEFFNIAAETYEEVDGRRDEKTSKWLDEKIAIMAKETTAENFLDIGCGTGFAMKKSRKYFKNIYGIDISEEMLKKIDFGTVVCGDIAKMPFQDNFFDAVSCIAVLHHCYNINDVLKDAYRVLKPNGIFYSDHDIDRDFVKKFYILLKLYRQIFNMKRRYLKSNKKLTSTLYDHSEIHQDGINTVDLEKQLKEIGFKEVIISYHWKGLTGIIDKIINITKSDGYSRRGFAPSFSIWAKK